MGSGTRVLMTADTVGGVWQYATRLAATLVTRGVTVALATMGREPSDAQRAEAAAAGVMLHTSTYALEWVPGAWDEVDRAGEWLLSVAEKFSPDIVHLNGYCHATLAWNAPVLIAAHSCVYSWWKAVHGVAPPDDWQEYGRRVTAGLRAANAVVTPSRAMKDALVACYGIAADAHVIPNAGEPPARTACGKENLIFAAGRVWDPAKNLTALDTAAHGLPWPVVIAGDRSSENITAPPAVHARHLGPLSARDVATWMARAQIYALPARYEPFGLSVLEAAGAGCALVLGDIASLRENWTGAARFVHPGGPDELRLVLQDLIDRPGERLALGRAAQHRAASFSPARQVTAYEALYKEMVAGHGRTAHSSRTH